MVEKRSPRLLQRETVYRWFSELPSPQRVEFLCGLLDLCIPLELRFLGACLEDLARKDYHSLRDSEIKANNPADLGSLTNLTDEVVRSKLLVSLALLGSSHREAAGVLFRTLTHIDSVIHNYGLQLNEGRTGDEFLLLFTMAANHPAFSFHQKQVLRQELTKIQNIMASTSKSPPGMPPAAASATAAASHMAPCPGCHKVTSRLETPVHGVGNSLENALHASAHSMEESLPKRPSGKHSKVSVEKVELKGISPKRSDRTVEYAFEVLWSDSSVTSVTKSCVEVTEFISKLGQLYPEENLEKTISCLPGPDSFYLERNHVDLESDLRYLASFPPHIWKNDHVKKFFSTSSHLQLFQNSSPANTSLYKVGPSLAASGRPVCGVAGIPSSQNNPQHRSPPSAASAVLLSHCAHPGVAGATLSCRSQLENSLPVLLATASQTPQAQEQNGILEWLRKLRLHKYYPVFKQLTMEKFLSLTEDDLNKFESLTMGAKKKLKTQLELEKEKSEKRTANPADSSDSSSSSSSSSSVSTGVARVPPTTHVAPIQSLRSSHAADLRVEVDQPVPPNPPREGSSSEYSGPGSSSSSSSSSPMGIQTPREESSDSAEESERRLEIPLDSPEKEKPAPILSHFGPASARPTAQVLPSVQNEAGSGPPAHHPPVPVQLVAAAPAPGSPHVTPMRILNAMHKPEPRLLSSSASSSSSSMQSLLTLEERAKYSPPGPPPRSSLKMEKSLGGPVPEGPVLASHQPAPSHHHSAAVAAAPAAVVNFGPRSKAPHASTLDRMAKTQAQPGGMVESSPATAATSNALFHMARPPIKLLVSSSLPTEATLGGPSPGSNNIQFSLPPTLISPRTALYSANTKVAFSTLGSNSSSLPMGSPMPSGGGGFCANGNAASPTTTTTPFANLNHGPPCPAPNQSPPTLSPATENGFYPSGTNQNHRHHHHHHHHPPQQPPSCLVCSSCGCSGNCGSGGVTVSYGNYFQPAFSGPSVLTFPFLPFGPLCGGNGYLNAQQYNGNGGGGTAFPVVHSPYSQSAAMAPDSLLSGQSAFAVPPMQSFLAGTAGVYQAAAMLGGGGGGTGGHKKNGNLSCYNCGASGHRAQDCKQPPMDFNRQGTFRLKYAPPAESLDSTD